MSDTITIVAVLRAADGAAEKVAGILHRAVAPSRAEAGCRGYVLHHDRSDHQRFVFLSLAGLDIGAFIIESFIVLFVFRLQLLKFHGNITNPLSNVKVLGKLRMQMLKC